MATAPRTLDEKDLEALFACLRDDGYRVAGPRLSDPNIEGAAIVLDLLDSFNELPRGIADTQHPGHYRLQDTQDGSRFRYAVGPHSIKQFLYPAHQQLWSATRNDSGLAFRTATRTDPPLALFGVRACDLAAIHVLDRVFEGDARYAQRRAGLVVITATCIQPGGTCFCTSMGNDVKTSASDINLTELAPGKYLADAGTSIGSHLLARCGSQPATPPERGRADDLATSAREQITRRMPNNRLPERLQAAIHHPHWDDIATRCLACANCTMVCPTCFCATVDDTIDLEGDHSERWLRWDSCFNADHSALHDGSMRHDTRTRYRQWLTHKLGTWHNQFDMSGCVGCGRCTTWCPVGIDLVEETLTLVGADP